MTTSMSSWTSPRSHCFRQQGPGTTVGP
jgi:hypothetical protein